MQPGLNYSLSHASAIKWALEQELNRLKVMKCNDETVTEFLLSRIKDLKEIENKWNTINSKG